jgi:hypothetical protein
MNLFSWLFRSQPKERKSSSDWRAELADRPDWILENIVRNTGEFTVEMRTAASEILAQRNAES